VEYQAAEFCEEESKEDSQPTVPPFFLIRTLPALAKIEVGNFPFISAFANAISDRFLVLQVIRV
jgi:hypothetical protein